MSKSAMLFAVALTVLLLSNTAMASLTSNGECTYFPNINITAPDMLLPKFVVSSGDCCNLCANTSGCVASVYANYFCHLKATQSPQIASSGPTTILQMNLPPTAAPTTAAPNVADVVLIREVSCQQSAQCNMVADYTCVTNVYVNNTCRGRKRRVCTTSELFIEDSFYSGPECSGSDVTNQSTAGVCDYYPLAQQYYGQFCDVVPAPVPNATVMRTSCSESCNSGSCIAPAVFTTGVCTATSQLSGEYTIAWAFPAYVVYNSYLTANCTGDIQSSIAEPLGECFPSGSPNTYVDNTFSPA
jgi:hypothetical protein